MQLLELVPPERAVERVPVDEEHCRPGARRVEREAHPVDHEATHVARRRRPAHERHDVLRHRHRAPAPVDADEDELRRGDEGVVAHPARSLPHREARASMVCERLLETEHVSGKGAGVIVDGRLPHGWPDAGAIEDVHPRSAREHFPARALEEAQEGRLVQVAEGVTLVGVDREIDLWSRHARIVRGEEGLREGRVVPPADRSDQYSRARLRTPLPLPGRDPMPPTTDYVRHAARLARKIHLDAAMGGSVQPDSEFFKTLAKALEEIAAAMEQIGKRE